MRSLTPREFTLPPSGIVAVESRHSPEFTMEAQQHPFHEVFLLLRGTVSVGLTARHQERLEYTLQPGDYLIVPAGTSHFITDQRASTLVVVAFADTVLDTVPGRREIWSQITGLREREEASGVRHVPSAPEHLRDPAWRRLIALGRSVRRGGGGGIRTASGRIELETAFNEFLLELSTLSGRPRYPDARERVYALVHALPDLIHESWPLDRAAAAAHLSRRRFSDLWRDVTGETFITSLQKHRVAAAQRLMIEEDLSIVAAAFTAGFDDLTHFYKVFRRHTGIPPGRWIARTTSDADES
ncbi:MAG: AraC family transcriptional regulator [Alkalispirochaeta sp.]